MKKTFSSLLLLIFIFGCQKPDSLSGFLDQQNYLNLEGYPFSQRKADLYFLGKTNTLVNYHYSKLWNSAVFHYDSKKRKIEEIPLHGGSYCYNIDLFTVNSDQSLVLIYFSTHMGNGGCQIYLFNNLHKTLSLKFVIDDIKGSKGAFAYQLSGFYVADHQNTKRELVFTGYGYINKINYRITRKIFLSHDFKIENDIKIVDKREYLDALLFQFYSNVRTTDINHTVNELGLFRLYHG